MASRANPGRTTAAKSKPADPKVIVLDEEDDAGFYEQKAPLFSLAGVTYDARINFSANEVNTFSRVFRTEGADAANEWLMRQALGDEGFTAFYGFKHLRKELYKAVCDTVYEYFKDGSDPK